MLWVVDNGAGFSVFWYKLEEVSSFGKKGPLRANKDRN